MNIIVYREPIDLANLYLYNLLSDGAKSEAARYKAVVRRLQQALDIYADKNTDLADALTKLKLELRLVTKGTPVTEPLDAVSAQPVLKHHPQFNQQQYDAHRLLLKQAYRKLCSLCHPDKNSSASATALFQEIRDAYESENLPRLHQIYIDLVNGRNVWWQSSVVGLEHASTEYSRPEAQLQMLKQSPIFPILMFHAVGAVNSANELMRLYLASEIQAIQNELHYIRSHHGKRNQASSSEKSTDERIEEREIEAGQIQTQALANLQSP